MDPFRNDTLLPAAASLTSTAGWFVPFIIGILVVGLLIGVVWWDTKRKRARAPRPDEQPRRPDHRTHIEEVRTEEEFRPNRGLSPYELGDSSSRPAPPGTPPGHDDNRGGGFGSGGLGG